MLGSTSGLCILKPCDGGSAAHDPGAPHTRKTATKVKVGGRAVVVRVVGGVLVVHVVVGVVVVVHVVVVVVHVVGGVVATSKTWNPCRARL